MIELIVNSKNEATRSVTIHQLPFIIGRSLDCDLVLTADGISRQHAKLSEKDGKVFITDLGSTNGLFVNGNTVTRLHRLDGDEILTFGEGIFVSIVVKSNYKVKAENGKVKNKSNLLRMAQLILPALLLPVLVTLLYKNYCSPNKPGREGSPSPTILNKKKLPGDREFQSLNTIKRLGTDIGYVIPSQMIIKDIDDQINQFSGDAHFAAVLQTYQSKLTDIDEASKKYNISPYLICYVDITDRFHNQNDRFFLMKWQDKLHVLIRLILPLQQIRGNSADSALSTVVGYRLCYECPAADHPLFGILGKSKTNNTTVWNLYEQNLITKDVYDYVIKLIAIGVLSYEPGKFGINSPPIAF